MGSLLLLLAVPTVAQDVMDKLAEYCCGCFAQKDTDNMKSGEMQLVLGTCMMEGVSKYPKELAEEYGEINITDQEGLTKLGEQIGMRMAFKCPTILMAMANDTELMDEILGDADTAADTSEYTTITGKLIAIEGTEMSRLIVADASGRKHKLLWMGYFPGSEQLVNNPKVVVGQTVSFTYETVECYSPKLKDYINCKVLRGVEY